ncbi:MFS transporter [Streptomyces sp. NBC_01304]|uniref:MFS transporter n=1 Tax=Streptomyces sp. NBC_01304 TaxID=2903818 RepID=UPI002E0E3EF3|nr:MFS transporter [Streptomyces sp. NBC_01304]
MATKDLTPVQTLGAAPVKPTGGSGSPGLTLFAALLGIALMTLDASVVNVALPAIADDLGSGMAGLQWVVDSYTLAFASLMLSTGAFADRTGATRAYAIGIALFTLASAACGFAPSLGVLIAARVVQGVAAAVVLPASLSLVRQAYPDAAQRARAVALWAAGGSVALALGPVAGGALITWWGWPGIFFINLPLGALTLVLLVRAPRSLPRPAPLDLPGQLTAVVALTALTFAVIERGTTGLISLAVAVAAALAFAVIESRQPHPVVPLGLFRNRTVAIVVPTGVAISVTFYGMIFVFSLFFQQEQGSSALMAGLLFLPMTALIVVANIVSGKLAGRFGPRLPMLVGQSLAIAGLLLLVAFASADRSPWGLAFLMLPMAVGCGLTIPPLTAAMMEAVPASRAGTAAGVLNSARQVGGGLAVAAFGSLIAGDFEAGMRVCLLVSAGLLAVTAAGTVRLRTR